MPEDTRMGMSDTLDRLPDRRLGEQGQVIDTNLYPDRCKECGTPIKGVVCDDCEP